MGLIHIAQVFYEACHTFSAKDKSWDRIFLDRTCPERIGIKQDIKCGLQMTLGELPNQLLLGFTYSIRVMWYLDKNTIHQNTDFSGQLGEEFFKVCLDSAVFE